MAQLTESEKQVMRDLFVGNGLTKDDLFQHRHFTIIKRTGIEKIQANNKIAIEYEEVVMERDFVVIKARATMDGIVFVETYGEAGPDNCKNTYYVMTAEKRALSRAVLKCVGMYMHNVFGEDENVDSDE